jgi:hypothetical protein
MKIPTALFSSGSRKSASAPLLRGSMILANSCEDHHGQSVIDPEAANEHLFDIRKIQNVLASMSGTLHPLADCYQSPYCNNQVLNHKDVDDCRRIDNGGYRGVPSGTLRRRMVVKYTVQTISIGVHSKTKARFNFQGVPPSPRPPVPPAPSRSATKTLSAEQGLSLPLCHVYVHLAVKNTWCPNP